MIVHWKKIPYEYLDICKRNPNLGACFYQQNEKELDWWRTLGVSFYRRKDHQGRIKNYLKEVNKR